MTFSRTMTSKATTETGLSEKNVRRDIENGQGDVGVGGDCLATTKTRTANTGSREGLPAQEITFPDGGLRAWGVVFGAFLAQFCSYGYLTAFGVYQDYYTRVYMTKHSASAISWIGSVESFLMITTGLIGGRLYDKGYCVLLLYCGAFLTSLSLFFLALVKPNHYFEAFLCQGLGIGLGGGMTYVPSLAIASHYFDKRRASAMSIVTAGVSLGGTVNPIIINSLLARTHLGFGSVALIDAGILTSILVVACILMKPRLPPPERHASLIGCLRKFSKDWAYIAMTVGFTLFALGYFFPPFYLQLAATTRGLDRKFAFNSLVIMNACGFIMRMFCGFIAQVVSVEYLAVVSAFVCGCIIFAFIGIRSAASVVLIGVLYGSFSGIYVAVMAPLADLLTDDVTELGIRLGISFACSGLGELIGPPITGALLTGETGEYHWWRPAVFSGVVVLAAGGCFGGVALVVRRRVAM